MEGLRGGEGGGGKWVKREKNYNWNSRRKFAIRGENTLTLMGGYRGKKIKKRVRKEEEGGYL